MSEDDYLVLAADELWDDNGHLSELSLVSAADGQEEVLSSDVLDHLAGCELCGERVGELALQSLEVNDALRAKPATTKARAPLPASLMAAALLLALVGALPTLSSVPASVLQAPITVLRAVPLVYRMGGLLWRSLVPDQNASIMVWTAATAVLLLVGISVARLLPRTATQKGVG